MVVACKLQRSDTSNLCHARIYYANMPRGGGSLSSSPLI